MICNYCGNREEAPNKTGITNVYDTDNGKFCDIDCYKKWLNENEN